MVTEDRRKEICQAFQAPQKREVSDEISKYTLEELQQVDQQLGTRDTNSSYRLALQQRIRDLEDEERERAKKRQRRIEWAVSFVIGLAAATMVTSLF